MKGTAAMTAQRDAFFTEDISTRDPEIHAAITAELGRQRKEIELIASENIVSAAVMQAQGSVMTNKYAEGYPGRRYYGGCQHVDVAENLAVAGQVDQPKHYQMRAKPLQPRDVNPSIPQTSPRVVAGYREYRRFFSTTQAR